MVDNLDDQVRGSRSSRQQQQQLQGGRSGGSFLAAAAGSSAAAAAEQCSLYESYSDAHAARADGLHPQQQQREGCGADVEGVKR